MQINFEEMKINLDVLFKVKLVLWNDKFFLKLLNKMVIVLQRKKVNEF